jgi:hypothetical protein
MPDIWTFNREKVKIALISQGASCEKEPRVLTDRDPFWTCHIDLEEMDADGVIGYDIYIHDANDFFYAPNSISLITLFFTGGFFLAYLIKSIIR